VKQEVVFSDILEVKLADGTRVRGCFALRHRTRQVLLHKGFVLSMSRAGTPTDNGYAERFVGVFKLAVADRRPSQTLGEFLQAAQVWINFYIQERPHEGLDNLSPLQFAQQYELEDIPSLALW
jgi:putative transposase